MNEVRQLGILLAPHQTEKAMRAGNQVAFVVAKTATKPEIKKAVEALFDVAVEHVRIVNIKSKVTRFRQRLGRHKGWKKAYVTLQAGQQIDFVDANA